MQEEKWLDRIESMVNDRAAGMTYAEIGAKYGVSRQRIGQVYKKYNKYNFKAIKECGCVYINVRDWMNQNSIDRTELLQLIHYDHKVPTSADLHRMYNILLGRLVMPNEMTRRIAKITGLSCKAVLEIG